MRLFGKFVFSRSAAGPDVVAFGMQGRHAIIEPILQMDQEYGLL
jgi:hypothetical protein